MTTRDLVNHILLTGQKGYKDMEDGNRISDKMTLLVKEHIKAEADKMVSERLRDELIRYIKWYGGFNYENMTDEMLVNEYLKTREP